MDTPTEDVVSLPKIGRGLKSARAVARVLEIFIALAAVPFLVLALEKFFPEITRMILNWFAP